MQFTPELEQKAVRTVGGEYAWKRSEAVKAVGELSAAGLAILGGELWMVNDTAITGVLPLVEEPLTAVYHWGSERLDGEAWERFVSRSYAHAIEAIEDLPAHGEVAIPEGAEIYYNIVWVSQREFESDA